MKIYDKAKAERDVPQMMKAYLTAMQYRTLVTPDSLETDMKGLENWAKQTEKAEDRAVLYSILGELTISKDGAAGPLADEAKQVGSCFSREPDQQPAGTGEGYKKLYGIYGSTGVRM